MTFGKKGGDGQVTLPKMHLDIRGIEQCLVVNDPEIARQILAGPACKHIDKSLKNKRIY